MVVGFIVAAFRIVLELVKDSLDSNSLLFKLGDMNFLTFGAWFFLFCIGLTVVVSLLTKAPTDKKVENLTFGTISEEEKIKNSSSYGWVDIAVSVLVVALVVLVMIFFNGK